jgi:hypothetical protein
MTSIDQKIDRLWELYRDFAIIKELPVDVEEIKRRGNHYDGCYDKFLKSLDDYIVE